MQAKGIVHIQHMLMSKLGVPGGIAVCLKRLCAPFIVHIGYSALDLGNDTV